MKSKVQTSLKLKTLQQQPEGATPMQHPRFGGARIALVGLGLAVLTGCVSSSKYDSLATERDNLLAEQALLSSQVAETEAQKQAAAKQAAEAQAEIERQKEAAAKKAAEAQAEIDRQKGVYDNLQSTFAKEQEANQVKIEMIKSGIKVNLANEILFPSGSAELNEMGVEVLTRAAAELKKSPYQTTVAGFTDDITINGTLQYKYPTNWELAAARAASVVRLLEKEGVAPDKLLALSYGKNNPVESNDTPEGRSKNRRIEIIQRPIPVSMD